MVNLDPAAEHFDYPVLAGKVYKPMCNFGVICSLFIYRFLLCLFTGIILYLFIDVIFCLFYVFTDVILCLFIDVLWVYL